MRKTRQQLFDENTRRVELLTTPMGRLGVSLRSGLLGKCLKRFREELEREKLALRPYFYLGNEYGCVEGTGNVSLGFWDTDEDLRALNHEGRGFIYDERELMALLRHEMGHAFCYSYKLYRDRDFRRLFEVEGHFFNTYPSGSRFRKWPWSRDFVNPNGDHYAQKHPDDDFAETFAVWMDRSEGWRARYRHKPGAIRKLKYVDETVRKLGRKQPVVENHRDLVHSPIESIRMTVGGFLGISPRRYFRKATGYIDPDLKEIFNLRRAGRGRVRAVEFLKQNRRFMSDRLVYWSGVGEYAVKDILDKVSLRLKALELYVKKEDVQRKLLELMSYLSVLLMNYRHTEMYLPRNSH